MEKILKKIKLKNTKENLKRVKFELVRGLIKFMINDLIQNTRSNILKFDIGSYEDIRLCKSLIVSFSDYMKVQEKQIKFFLQKKMYNHPKVRTMTYKAKRIISDLFDLFVDETDLLPGKWKLFKSNNEKFSNISDYISGMTDKFAMNIHRKFFNLYEF